MQSTDFNMIDADNTNNTQSNTALFLQGFPVTVIVWSGKELYYQYVKKDECTRARVFHFLLFATAVFGFFQLREFREPQFDVAAIMLAIVIVLIMIPYSMLVEYADIRIGNAEVGLPK